MTGMRAVQVTENGPPVEVLAVRTVERPVPGPGQVLVEVGAASLNFNDIDRCLGTLVSVPTPPPIPWSANGGANRTSPRHWTTSNSPGATA